MVYKKLLPIYRGVFLEMETPSTTTVISSYDLLKIIWTAFSLLKSKQFSCRSKMIAEHLKQEDLLNSYNLLLCVIELVYEWICKLHLDELVNHEFSGCLLCLLEKQCRRHRPAHCQFYIVLCGRQKWYGKRCWVYDRSYKRDMDWLRKQTRQQGW